MFALGGCGRQLHAFDALVDDRLDHRGDHGGRRRPPVTAAQRGHGPRHRRRERNDRRAVDERRLPSHGDIDHPALRTLRDAEARHDRTGGGQSDSFERDVPEPEHARSDADTTVATADGDEPAERILHRNRQRVGTHPAGQRDARIGLPAERWPSDRFQAGRQLGVRFRRRCPARPPRPRRDRRPTTPGAAPHPARGPRRRPRGRRRVSGGRFGGRRTQDRGRRAERLWSVSVRSATTRSRSSPGRLRTDGEILLGVDDQAVEHDERRPLVGMEERDVVVRAPAVS